MCTTLKRNIKKNIKKYKKHKEKHKKLVWEPSGGPKSMDLGPGGKTNQFQESGPLKT